MKYKKEQYQKGFTIVELMIATVVFSFVMLVASSGAIAIGRSYYKAITSSKTQETARNVMENLSRSVEFSGRVMEGPYTLVGGPAHGAHVLCIGNDRYIYYINQNLSLAREDRPNNCQDNNISPNFEELLGDNMRLLELSVSADNPHKIVVTIAYTIGNDLLSPYNDDSTIPGDGVVDETEAAAAYCKPGIAGSNFCSVSRLETTIGERIDL